MPVPGSEALFARLRPFALAERSESDTPRFVPDVGERSCSSRERRTARLEARASRAAIPSPRSGCRAVVSFAVASDRALRSIDPIPVGSRPVPAKGRPARKARRRATRASPRAFPTRAGSRFRGTRESPRESACTRGTRRRSRRRGLQGLCSLCSPVDSEVVYATRGSVTVCTFAATGSALAKGAAAATESRRRADAQKGFTYELRHHCRTRRTRLLSAEGASASLEDRAPELPKIRVYDPMRRGRAVRALRALAGVGRPRIERQHDRRKVEQPPAHDDLFRKSLGGRARPVSARGGGSRSVSEFSSFRLCA